jgi:hypothetical protein
MELDLDAARAARREKTEPKSFTLGGDRFDLPLELPLAVGMLWEMDKDMVGGLRLLLGDSFDRFNAVASDKDLEALVLGFDADGVHHPGIAEMYATEPGESVASVASLPNGGKRSRRTSRASTG